MIHLLAIDYGRSHTGLAIATTPLPEPIATVSTHKVQQHITHLIDKHHIQAIVLGISENQMAKETRQFAATLTHFNLPLYLQDETLSSLETRQKLAQAGIKKSKRESKIDHLVAASILQAFIDTYDSLDTLDDLPKPATINKNKG